MNATMERTRNAQEQEHHDMVLVNTFDEVVGTMEKMETHRRGLLHRAVSVILLRSGNEVLLQQRALGKYHSAGLWSNTCCTHARLNEFMATTAQRRLKEEMGLDVGILHYWKQVIYRAELDHGLIEHELDHVFVGFSDAAPVINPQEVMAYKYVHLNHLAEEVRRNDHAYTSWAKYIFDGLTLELINRWKA